MTAKLGKAELLNLDRQIQDLMECKYLPDVEVKALCDKVNLFEFLFRKKRPKKF